MYQKHVPEIVKTNEIGFLQKNGNKSVVRTY